MFVKNDWNRVFEELNKLAEEVDFQEKDSIILLQSRYQNIRRHEINMTLGWEQLEIEFNKLRHSTFQFISEIEKLYKEQTGESRNENWKPEKRLALIIGCDNYMHAGKLANPLNDAKDMANSLSNLYFDVEVVENPDLKELKMKIDEFGDKLESYETGLFYFAGHGVQVKGLNYLIPVDANLTKEKMVEYDCVNANRILTHMESSKNEVNLIVLDACRNNPFERSWNRSILGRGLAVMDAPKGSLIAYATAPGRTASDGNGRNGLYTGALLNNMQKPNVPIFQIFQEVRKEVMEKSSDHQIPWESTSLTADFYFSKK